MKPTVSLSSLDECARLWLAAKHDENTARQRRLAVENEIVRGVGVADEGNTRQNTDAYKITTTGKLNRRVDIDALTALADDIPEPIIARLIRHKAEVDTRELRYLQDNEPELYSIIAEAVTVKPAKPVVSVVPITDSTES